MREDCRDLEASIIRTGSFRIPVCAQPISLVSVRKNAALAFTRSSLSDIGEFSYSTTAEANCELETALAAIEAQSRELDKEMEGLLGCALPANRLQAGAQGFFGEGSLPRPQYRQVCLVHSYCLIVWVLRFYVKLTAILCRL